jgi:hypothetical protein
MCSKFSYALSGFPSPLPSSPKTLISSILAREMYGGLSSFVVQLRPPEFTTHRRRWDSSDSIVGDHLELRLAPWRPTAAPSSHIQTDPILVSA